MRTFGVMCKGAVMGTALFIMSCAFFVSVPDSGEAVVIDWDIEENTLEARSDAAVVTNESGVTFIFGGYSTLLSVVSNTSSSYDLATGATEQLPNMTTAVVGPAGTLGPDGRIYVLGGQGTNGICIPSTQIYDPQDRTWSAGLDMPYAVWGASAACQDGLIYVVGGWKSGAQNHVQILDLSTGTWSLGPSLPMNRMNGELVSDGEYLYYIGGSEVTSTASNGVFRYSPKLGTWDSVAPMPLGRQAIAATMGPDGLIYIMGGSSNWLYGDYGSSSVYYYDPFANRWGSASILPYPVKYAGAAALDDGRIFMVGGNSETTISLATISLRVVNATAVITDSSLPAGGTTTITVSTEFKYARPSGFDMVPQLKGADGVPFAYRTEDVVTSSTSSFASLLTIPEPVPPGQYRLELRLFVHYGDGSWEVRLPEMAVTVTDGVTDAERAEVLAADLADLTEMVGDLEAELEAVRAELESAATQEDIVQVQDAVHGKADSMLSYLTIGLLTVVIVIMAMMMVMMKRKG